MNTDKTRKRSSKGLMNVSTILAAILISLMMQGGAQAYWGIESRIWLVWRGGW